MARKDSVNIVLEQLTLLHFSNSANHRSRLAFSFLTNTLEYQSVVAVIASGTPLLSKSCVDPTLRIG